jgi:hypothetical protein
VKYSDLRKQYILRRISMSNINISNLDSANEIGDLSDRELDLQGGSIWSWLSDAVSWVVDHVGFSFTDGGGIISVKF